MTFDQLALQAPRGQNTILLQGKVYSDPTPNSVTMAPLKALARRVKLSNTLEEHLESHIAMPSKPHPSQ